MVCISIQIVARGSLWFGHVFFEGKRPTLLEHISQALITPMFVNLEYLFLFGFLGDLKEEINKKK